MAGDCGRNFRLHNCYLPPGLTSHRAEALSGAPGLLLAVEPTAAAVWSGPDLFCSVQGLAEERWPGSDA